MGAAYQGNDLYIVTEFVSKGALRSVLKNQAIPLSWQTRARVALDIACASNYPFLLNLFTKNLLAAISYKISNSGLFAFEEYYFS
jgi:hypothetical protein